MHFRARVVERRDAQEYIVARLAMVLLLGHTRAEKRAVLMQDGLGETVVPEEK